MESLTGTWQPTSIRLFLVLYENLIVIFFISRMNELSITNAPDKVLKLRNEKGEIFQQVYLQM